MSTESTDIVDYAMPLMNIERLTKEAFQQCLKKDFAGAADTSAAIAVEARMLKWTLTLMEEQQK